MKYVLILMWIIWMGIITIRTQKVGVLEYAPKLPEYKIAKTKEEAIKIQLTNLKEIEEMIEEKIDILVTPEYGLYGAYIRTPEEMERYCIPINEKKGENGSKSENIIIKETAKIAQRKQMGIVVNVCQKDNEKRYSTAIAIGKSGEILGKYQKTHLYKEQKIFTAGKGEVETFEIEGTKMGLLICFDIMFQQPIQDIKKKGVEILLFTTLWVNFSPLITAIPTQQAMAIAHELKIAAANGGQFYRVSGSSIIDEKGNVLKYTYNPTWQPKSKLLVHEFKSNTSNPLSSHEKTKEREKMAEREKTTKEREMNNRIKYDQKHAKEYKDYQVIQIKGNKTQEIEREINIPHVKCTIKGTLKSTKNGYIMIYAKSGQSLGERSGCLCGILYCGEEEKYCEEILDMNRTDGQSSPLSINQITIKGQFQTIDDRSSLKQFSLLPISPLCSNTMGQPLDKSQMTRFQHEDFPGKQPGLYESFSFSLDIENSPLLYGSVLALDHVESKYFE